MPVPNFALKKMSWIYLIIAGMMEVGFTFCLGKTKTGAGSILYLWWIGFLVALALSMYFMARAARSIPVSYSHLTLPANREGGVFCGRAVLTKK